MLFVHGLGMPMAVALGLSILTIILFAQDSLASLSSSCSRLTSTSPYGHSLLYSGWHLHDHRRRGQAHGPICQRGIGHLRGGLAMASVLACMLFAAVSGSSPATVVAVGSIVIAGMVKAGYPQSFAAGVICNAGTLGILIPPSIVMVVYGAATETSVGKLFMAGVIPGIMLGLMLMVAIYVRARMLDIPSQPRASLREVLTSGRDSLWGLLLIVIILGGIYGGIFTPTEAAAVAAVYALFIAVFRVPRHRHEKRPARSARIRQGDGDADVHRRQCAAVCPRADHRAHSAGHCRDHHGLGHAGLACSSSWSTSCC